MKNIVMTLSLALLPFVALSLSGTASALDTSAACSGVSQLSGTSNCGSGAGVDDVVHTAINILSIIVGIVAVVMIIVSGLKYITSGGEANKVGSAKTTLIYALIGLAIAVIAQALVHFAFNTATHAV